MKIKSIRIKILKMTRNKYNMNNSKFKIRSKCNFFKTNKNKNFFNH